MQRLYSSLPTCLPVLLGCAVMLLWAAQVAHPQVLAFPTAEGYGRFAQGGRGGWAYNINSLSAGAGEGGSCTPTPGGCTGGTITFRDCVTDRFAKGPRTCIFRTGGIIDFSGGGTTTCAECLTPVPPYLTIAGQTAPGDGILLKGIALSMRDTHDVIIRHIRSRPGVDTSPGSEHSSLKAFAAVGYTSPTHDIIFDHCSAGWNADDATATGGWQPTGNVTWQWMVISEGLSTPSFGGYGKGGITDSWMLSVSYLHNHIANMVDRLPFHQAGALQYVNNLIYNAPGALNVMPWYGDIHVGALHNYWKQGSAATDPYGRPESPYIRTLCHATDNCAMSGQLQNCQGGQAAYIGRCTCTDSGIVGDHCTSQIYVHGNVHDPLVGSSVCTQNSLICRAGDDPNNDVPSYGGEAPPAGFPVMPVVRDQTSAAQAYADVLAYAGAYRKRGSYVGPGSPGQRYSDDRSDTPDQRARTDTQNNTGKWRETTVEGYQPGGYGTYAAGTPYVDTDGDGMPDDWEDSHGLNKHDPTDGPAVSGTGYTHLENFLNDLAGDGQTTRGRLPEAWNLRSTREAKPTLQR